MPVIICPYGQCDGGFYICFSHSVVQRFSFSFIAFYGWFPLSDVTQFVRCSLYLSPLLYGVLLYIYVNNNNICILNLPPPSFPSLLTPRKMPQHPRHPVPKRFTQITPRGGILHFRCHYCDAVLQTRDGLRVHLNSVHSRLYRCQFCDYTHSQLRRVITHERQRCRFNFHQTITCSMMHFCHPHFSPPPPVEIVTHSIDLQEVPVQAPQQVEDELNGQAIDAVFGPYENELAAQPPEGPSLPSLSLPEVTG